MEPQSSGFRPDDLDDLLGQVLGKARPVVDTAIDDTALLVLGAVIDLAADIRDDVPLMATSDSPLYQAAYAEGWDCALTEFNRKVSTLRQRIDRARRQHST